MNRHRTGKLFSYSIIALFSFAILTPSFAQKKAFSSGSVIILSAKGLVQAIDPAGNLVNGILKPGAVLAEGYSLKTGFGGEASLLFSNGTLATLEPRSTLKIVAFLQEDFNLGGKKIEDLQSEPSSSQLDLDLSTGSLVVETKKLSRSSNFSITTPLGTAGIRGTAFQIGITPGGEVKLDVSSSSVSFTPVGGIAIIVNQGNGMDISVSGLAQQRPLNAVISINIKTKNSKASKIASLIPLNTVKQANQKASAISIIGNNAPGTGVDNTRKGQGKDNTSDEDETEEVESKDSDASEQYLDQDGKDLRSLSGAETSEGYYLNIILSLANSSDEVGLGATDLGVVLENGQLLIKLYADNFNDPPEIDGEPTVLASLPIQGKSLEQILDYLSINLEHPEYDNEIIASALTVFLDIHDLYDGNDKINDALQGALQLSHVFLTPVQISNGREFSYSQINSLSRNDIAQGTLLNAQDLKSSYENNPYLYEVGMILAQYGAIGNGQTSQQSASSATEIARNILTFVGGKDDINIPDSISLGDESNSILIGSGLFGSAHNDLIDRPSESSGQEGVSDSLSKKTQADELYKIYLENIYGVVGSDITIGDEGVNNTIDVSGVLTKATRFQADRVEDGNNDKKIMAFAAAKDLHIKGDLHIKNQNRTEDHALVLGAADHIEVYDRKEGGRQEIFYEGSNLGLGSYSSLHLNDVDIDTGGNLALGSLSDIGITSSNFSVGRYSDRDNVYIFAEQTLAIDNLTFDARPAPENDRFLAGTARQIYMEAITIDLKEVHFPAESEVMLRSRDGLPVFYGGIYNDVNPSRVPGAVNFFSNSNSYGGSPITKEAFPVTQNANNGRGFDSIGQDFKTSTGVSAIKIRKFPD